MKLAYRELVLMWDFLIAKNNPWIVNSFCNSWRNIFCVTLVKIFQTVVFILIVVSWNTTFWLLYLLAFLGCLLFIWGRPEDTAAKTLFQLATIKMWTAVWKIITKIIHFKPHFKKSDREYFLSLYIWAHQRKLEKYKDLCEQCIKNGWSTDIFPLEIGCRDFIIYIFNQTQTFTSKEKRIK